VETVHVEVCNVGKPKRVLCAACGVFAAVAGFEPELIHEGNLEHIALFHPDGRARDLPVVSPCGEINRVCARSWNARLPPDVDIDEINHQDVITVGLGQRAAETK
jgi:hypothetical protein